MHFNYYSLTEHIITEFERDIKIIKQLNPKTFLDAYIECNCIYIIIENNCDTKYDKYFIFNLNDIDINEIKNLLKELNEEVNILKEFFYYLGTINEHNILINIREKKYMFLFYYDKLFNGEEYETRMNQEYSDLIDIGNFLDNLLKKIIKNINSVNPMNDFGGMNLSFYTIHINPMKFGYGYKNDVETYSFFLSKIIEKINNSMLWDNYYMECKYNILNGRQKKSICNIVINNKKSTGFFCQIFDKEIPFKKALITKNIGELPDILNLEYLNNNNEYITKQLKKGNRKILYNINFTCIELYNKDEIDNFLLISETVFNSKYKNNAKIALFQYLAESKNEKIYCSVGKIVNANEETFTYDAEMYEGGLGAPIVLDERSDIYVVGINIGKPTNSDYNKAKNIVHILKKIKYELSSCLLF